MEHGETPWRNVGVACGPARTVKNGVERITERAGARKFSSPLESARVMHRLKAYHAAEPPPGGVAAPTRNICGRRHVPATFEHKEAAMKIPLNILIEQERKRREAARDGARIHIEIEAPLPPRPEPRRPERGEFGREPVVIDIHSEDDEGDRGVTVFSIFGD